MSPLLAHQGNWDEILMFLIPVVLAIGAVRWAERRSRSKASREEAATSVSNDGRSDRDTDR